MKFWHAKENLKIYNKCLVIFMKTKKKQTKAFSTLYRKFKSSLDFSNLLQKIETKATSFACDQQTPADPWLTYKKIH